MRLKEQRLWDAMKKAAPKSVWLQRVENLVASGVPDVHVSFGSGTSCWVELKAPTRPTRPTTPLLGEKQGLNLDQRNWHIKAAAMNQRSFILIRDSARELYLISGREVARINKMSVGELRDISLADDWDYIYEVLK